MINELLRFRDSLVSWGHTIPNGLHRQLERISTRNKFILVTLSESGFTTQICNHMLPGFCVCRQQQQRTLFKYDPEKVEKAEEAFKSCKYAWDELLSRTGSMTGIHNIVAYLNTCSITEILADTKIKSTGGCYLVFDTADRFQTESNWSLINNLLLSVVCVQSGSTDFFGNDDTGCEERSCVAKGESKHDLMWYSKNQDNPCYERWGLNSVDACRVGLETRTEISKLWQWIVVDAKKITKDNKNGLWFDYKRSKRDSNTFIVLSTLFPRNELLDLPAFLSNLDNPNDLALAWKQETSSIISALRSGYLDGRPLQDGQVIIIRKPGKGPAILEYSKTLRSFEIADYVKQWDNGLNNWFQLQSDKIYARPLTIRSAQYYLNMRWRIADSKIQRSEPSARFTLEDAYELFFSNKSTARIAAESLAQFSIPIFFNSYGAGCYDIQHLRSLCFLVLHKLSIFKESYVDNWPFALGRLFQVANTIHYFYFDSRGLNAPNIRIGQRFSKMAHSNPCAAFKQFNSSFKVFLTFAERDGRCLKEYKELLNVVGSNGDLPLRLNATEALQFALGYSCGKPTKSVELTK